MRHFEPAGPIWLSAMLLTAACIGPALAQECSPTPRGSWGGPGSGQTQFNNPMSVCVLPSGDVAVIDFWNVRVKVFTSAGEPVIDWYVPGFPVAIDSDAVGRLFVLSREGRIYRYSSFGILQTSWQYPNPEDYFLGVDLDVHGDEVYAATNLERVTRFTLDGAFLGTFPTSRLGVRGIAVGPGGDLFATNELNHEVCRYTSAGTLMECWGSLGAGPTQFDHPSGLTVTSDGFVLVADEYNDRMSVWTRAGQHVCVWGQSGSGAGHAAGRVATSGTRRTSSPGWAR